jgi:hypothetical protein
MTNEHILQTLASLESRLVRLEQRLDAALAKPAQPTAGMKQASAAGRVATDGEMDGQRGNPEVRNNPKRWSGEDCKGRRFSECPPDFLDDLASLFDWMADKDDEAGARGELDPRGYAKDGKWKRLDAALARGWAKRLRDGWGAGQSSLDGIL